MLFKNSVVGSDKSNPVGLPFERTSQEVSLVLQTVLWPGSQTPYAGMNESIEQNVR